MNFNKRIFPFELTYCQGICLGRPALGAPPERPGPHFLPKYQPNTSNITRPQEFYIDYCTKTHKQCIILVVLMPLSEYFLYLLCICGRWKNINDPLVAGAFSCFLKLQLRVGVVRFASGINTISYAEEPSPIIKKSMQNEEFERRNVHYL